MKAIYWNIVVRRKCIDRISTAKRKTELCEAANFIRQKRLIHQGLNSPEFTTTLRNGVTLSVVLSNPTANLKDLLHELTVDA